MSAPQCSCMRIHWAGCNAYGSSEMSSRHCCGGCSSRAGNVSWERQLTKNTAASNKCDNVRFETFALAQYNDTVQRKCRLCAFCTKAKSITLPDFRLAGERHALAEMLVHIAINKSAPRHRCKLVCRLPQRLFPAKRKALPQNRRRRKSSAVNVRLLRGSSQNCRRFLRVRDKPRCHCGDARGHKTCLFALMRAPWLKESALAGTAAKWRPRDHGKLARAGVGVCFCFSSPQCNRLGHQKVAVTTCDLLCFLFFSVTSPEPRQPWTIPSFDSFQVS